MNAIIIFSIVGTSNINIKCLINSTNYIAVFSAIYLKIRFSNIF